MATDGSLSGNGLRRRPIDVVPNILTKSCGTDLDATTSTLITTFFLAPHFFVTMPKKIRIRLEFGKKFLPKIEFDEIFLTSYFKRRSCY